MIDLNNLAHEIHEAAVEKGFWSIDDAIEKHIAKMHCELSEAVQEDRAGMPMIYVDDVTLPEPITDPAKFDGRKPEGVAVELADFVMMLLDYAVATDILNVRPKEVVYKADADISIITSQNTLELVNNMHEGIVFVTEDYLPHSDMQLLFMVYCIEDWLAARNINLYDVIRMKMLYNKSRPALHGRRY